MEAKTRTAITFAVLIVLIFGAYFFTDWFSKATGYVLGEDEKESIAKCLAEKGAVFYFSSTCPKCDEQIQMFGNTAVGFLVKYGCESADECPADGGVPAWKINDKFYYGKKNFAELQKLSGCKIK
jgi:hypothetical protein